MSKTLYYDVDGVLLDFTGPFVNFWNEGLKQNLWTGNVFSNNPDTWAFGLRNGIDDMKELNRVLDIFHKSHDHLPILHPDIAEILSDLKTRHRIELVTAYPDAKKRLDNLLHHELSFDVLSCNVNDKVTHVRKSEQQGNEVVAIFEDGPHHLDKFLPHYPGKLWAPSQWKYLESYKNDSRIRFYDSPHEWKEL